MNLLYFDTTQEWIHVVVGTADTNSNIELKSKLIETSPKEASYRLVEMIKTALEKSQIKKPDVIVVPNGPGSFTGIRITVSTARNLAQLWEIPVLGFDSAELYFVGIKTQEIHSISGFQTSILCLDGKQGKFYTKIFYGDLFSETKDQTPEEISTSLKNQQITPNNWYYTGTFPSFYPDSAIKIEATNLNLSSILKYSLEQYKQTQFNNYNYLSLLPNYIRGTYVDQK